jgi:hypothetical protein
MVIYDSRKKELEEAFGDKNKCLTSDSWLDATLQDLLGAFRLYTEDIDFMYNNVGACYTEEAKTTKQGVVIYADGIRANVVIDGVTKGTTDRIIDLEPGPYTASLEKTGYVTQEIAFIVTSGKYAEKYATMVATPGEETEIPVETPTSGPILQLTGNYSFPDPLEVGNNNWFGFEFKNVGDEKWYGMVGIHLTSKDGSGNTISDFTFQGDATKKQTVQAGETKKLWVYCVVPTTFEVSETVTRAVLLTRG